MRDQYPASTVRARYPAASRCALSGIFVHVRNIVNDCEKFTNKAEDYAAEVNVVGMSVKRDSARAKAVGSAETMTVVLRGGVNEICPVKE